MIRIESLTKYYPRQQVPALDSIDLEIPQGSVFGLLGPNGAGKTTLVSILVGLQRKSAGEVFFQGKPLARSLARMRSEIGFVPQDLAFYPMLSVAENIAFYTAAFGVPKSERNARMEQAVATAELGPHYRKSAHALSGGLKRRLNLAIGLLNDPCILFLDEPTVGIDPQSRNFILETIAELNRTRGMTIIYTSHYMEEVQQLCDHIAIMDGGKIVLSGALQSLLESTHSPLLEFRLHEAVDAQTRDLLQQRFSARPLDERRFEVLSEDMSQLLCRLSEFLQSRGYVVDGIQYGLRSLEALYMSNTLSAPRD